MGLASAACADERARAPARSPVSKGPTVKRGGPLKRSSGLHVDPAKVRAFVERGRAELARAPLVNRASPGRSGTLRASRTAKPPEGPMTPDEWRRAVYVASGGRCTMTASRARDADDPRFHAHHVVPKRELRARGLYSWVWDARNGAWLWADAHERHENASQRVPSGRLPPAVWMFCAELDEMDGSEWATALVQRLHPATGTRGRRNRRSV